MSRRCLDQYAIHFRLMTHILSGIYLILGYYIYLEIPLPSPILYVQSNLLCGTVCVYYLKCDSMN